MFDEELVVLLQEAFQNSVEALRKDHPENFYYFAFVLDEEMHPYMSAWSYESLERDGKGLNEVEDFTKWAYYDSPYDKYGYDDFSKASSTISERTSKLSEAERHEEQDKIAFSMEEALRRLDQANFFGVGDQRKEVVINVEPSPFRQAELERAYRLNPSSPLLDEYIEVCGLFLDK